MKRILTVTALLLAPLAALHAGDGPRQKPNVVFILADDQRFDELGCTGHPLIKTPNIDRLAREGAVFENSFASSASCLPNRTSLLTGQWERRHTVGWNSGSALAADPWGDTLPMVLKRNGYTVAYLGKNHTPGLRHWDFDYYYKCQELYDHIHRLQPQVLVSYKQGLLGTEDFFAPEHKAVENPSGKPMEICSTLQEKSWGYNAQARHISTDEAWAKLAAASTARANLLLNTGPLPDGSIPEEHARVLRELGQRIRAEGWPA